MTNTITKRIVVGFLASVIVLVGLFANTPQASAAESCNSRTLVGAIDSGTLPINWRFVYSTNYNAVYNDTGTHTPTRVANSYGEVTAFITGLSPQTTYYFSLLMSNPYGTAAGDDILDFTTPACPVTTPPPTVEIYANPNVLSWNGRSEITWYPNNAESCTATGGSDGWAGPKNAGTQGTFQTGP